MAITAGTRCSGTTEVEIIPIKASETLLMIMDIILRPRKAIKLENDMVRIAFQNFFLTMSYCNAQLGIPIPTEAPKLFLLTHISQLYHLPWHLFFYLFHSSTQFFKLFYLILCYFSV